MYEQIQKQINIIVFIFLTIQLRWKKSKPLLAFSFETTLQMGTILHV